MSNENFSQANSHKLDTLASDVAKVRQLLEGEQDAPGVLARITLIETVIFGRHGKEGLATKVNFMWKVYVWLLCSLSGVVGYLFRELMVKMQK